MIGRKSDVFIATANGAFLVAGVESRPRPLIHPLRLAVLIHDLGNVGEVDVQKFLEYTAKVVGRISVRLARFGYGDGLHSVRLLYFFLREHLVNIQAVVPSRGCLDTLAAASLDAAGFGVMLWLPVVTRNIGNNGPELPIRPSVSLPSDNFCFANSCA